MAMWLCYRLLGPLPGLGAWPTGTDLIRRRTVELVNLGRSEKRQQNEPWPMLVLCIMLAMATP